MKSKNYLAILIVPLLFLAINIATIPNYGINWDNSMHYNRGHAYLHYFLTGKTNYLDLPKHKTLDESVDFKDIRGNYMPLFERSKRSTWESDYRRSYYQSDVFNFEYFKEKDSGHPPINGILAATSNYIFYQKLGILGDLYSHQLFGVVIAFLLVLGIAIFTFYLFGIFPAIIAASSLSLYPLFLGESHFNIKDPVLTSFFGLTIITIYFGVIKRKTQLIFLSAIFAGLSLGTKFNALFLPLIILPWLILYWWRNEKLKIKKKWIITLLAAGIIPFLIFYVFWPYLWFNGLAGVSSILNYYVDEGTGTTSDLSKFILLGFNFFPLTWIITTTPIPILIFSVIGIIWLINKIVKRKDHTSLLILLWLLVPILRVTFPNTTIYGGVRHVMEFIPALAITAGIGTHYFLNRFKKIKTSLTILISFLFVLVLIEMIKIHPNQNIYFNQLIGGLSGAKDKKIPYWGNSFGNAYEQGIEWLNKNAEPNAKLGLPIGGGVNLPKENLRSDIQFSNDNFSAFAKKGEYQMEMSHDGLPKNTFTYSYLDNFLNPIYEVKVDGVAILKVWKNDLAHTKSEFKNEKKIEIKNIIREESQTIIETSEEINLTRLYIYYGRFDCLNERNGNLSTSKNNLIWDMHPDPITYPQMNLQQINASSYDFAYLFPATNAKFIRINTTNPNSCMIKNLESTEIWGIQNSKPSQQ